VEKAQRATGREGRSKAVLSLYFSALTLRSAIKSSSRERTKDPGCWLASRGVPNRRDGAPRTPHHRGSREPWAVREARWTLALDRLRSPG